MYKPRCFPTDLRCPLRTPFRNAFITSLTANLDPQVDSVWSVSRAWRKAVLALSPALWRRVVVDVRPHDPAPALRLLRRAPSVGILKVHRLNDHAARHWPAVPGKVLTALEKEGSAKVRASGCGYIVLPRGCSRMFLNHKVSACIF